LSQSVVLDQTSLQQPRTRGSALERFDYLDALRGIAILGVILVHSAILSKQGIFLRDQVPSTRDLWVWIISFTGQRGVQLFYMVSAFTLFLSLDSGRKEVFRWSNFFIRRFCRIAPLFYLAILANLLLFGRVLSVKPYSELSGFDILLGFLFLHGFSGKAINSVAIGGWSIAVEATFYFLVPYLFTRIKTLSHAIYLFVASALVLGTISQQASIQPVNYMLKQYFSFLWFPVEFPVFVLGIVAYMTWKQFVKPLKLGDNSARPSLPTRELSMLLIFSSALLYFANLPFTDGGLYFSSFIFLPLILGLSLHSWKFLVNRFTRFMGKISFSVYLCHFFVLRLVEQILNRMDMAPGHLVTRYLYKQPLGVVVAYALTLAISVPLCMFTWRFVEQPGIRAGRTWIRKREERTSVARTPEVETLTC
jgi:peptidoglycan/LPS O-acetylase OafA/YrhL